MIVHGIDVYRTYLAFKQHFTNPKFDYFQYDGKVKVKETTYQQSRVFWFCETLARKHTQQEIQEFMLASFISVEDATKVWPGFVQRNGHSLWLVWQKRQASLTYTFQEDCERLALHMEKKQCSFNELFATLAPPPPPLRLFYKQQIAIESLIILDLVLGFMKQWDREFKDPLWEKLSFKIKKYKPFLSITTNKYRKIMKEKFL